MTDCGHKWVKPARIIQDFPAAGSGDSHCVGDKHRFLVILGAGGVVGRYAPGTVAQVVVDRRLISVEKLGGSWPGTVASSPPKGSPLDEGG